MNIQITRLLKKKCPEIVFKSIMGNLFRLTPVQSQKIAHGSLVLIERLIFSSSYYLAEAFSSMLYFQASAEIVKIISTSIYSSDQHFCKQEKKKHHSKCHVFYKPQKLFSTCFLHIHALTKSGPSERIHFRDCVVDFYQEPRKAIFQRRWKTHVFLTSIWLRAELQKEKQWESSPYTHPPAKKVAVSA